MNVQNIHRYAVAAGVALILSSQAHADHGLLSGAEIQSTLAGATAEGKTSKGKEYEVEYAANGAVKMSMKDNSFWDQGNWKVDGDAYCASWEKIRKGAENCWRLRHESGSKYVFEGIDGAETIEVIISR
ncbi:MAG: hypothetical protein ACWGQW_12995 [bacterium]